METGFEIGDAFYPLPKAFRMGDPILVEEVTGLTWSEFSDRMEDPEGDPAVMLGMLAVAIWQTNPRWRRERAARFAENINIENVKFLGDEPEPDANPPAEEPSAKADGSTSRSKQRAGSDSGTTLASTTPDGSPATTPGLA